MRLGQRMCRQLGKPFRCAALACRRAQVEEFATANRALCCRIAQDKPITGRCGRRLIKHQLNQALPYPAGSDRRRGERRVLRFRQRHDAGAQASIG